MRKRTQRLAVGALLGAFACLCAGTAAAQAPSLNVGSVSGAPGAKVSFPVTLALNGSGAQVAGTQNNLAFDASTPIGVRSGSYCALTQTTTCTTSADCPVYPSPFDHEACVSGKCSVTTAQTCTTSADCPLQREACVPSPTGAPDCAVNPAVTAKDAFFAFTPNGCSGATCTGISAIVVGVNNLTAIPDNTQLYTCNVNIAQNASGTYPLTISGTILGDTNGAQIQGATGNSGQVTVTAGVQILVCDVVPSSGDNAGQFGNGQIENADVVALFRASLNSSVGPPPPPGTDRFVAMDSAPADSPPTCGGDTTIQNNDVVTCFRQSLGTTGGTKYIRTVSGATCTSAVAP